MVTKLQRVHARPRSKSVNSVLRFILNKRFKHIQQLVLLLCYDNHLLPKFRELTRNLI